MFSNEILKKYKTDPPTREKKKIVDVFGHENTIQRRIKTRSYTFGLLDYLNGARK